MLPSKGYFSAIPCVFYLAGNCERPHCHYRHCARDKTNNGNDGLDSPSEAVEERNWLGSNLSESFVTEMVEKAVDKVFVEDPTRAETLDRDHIIKTALDKLKQETIMKKVNANQKGQSSGVGFPSYKPTPIAELNKRHIPVVYAPERPLSAIRKEKSTEDKSQIGTSLLITASFSELPKKLDDPGQCISNSLLAAPVQGSVVNENSLDTQDDGSLDVFSELLDRQVEGNDSSTDVKSNAINVYSMSSAASVPSSEAVTNTVGALCDNLFTQFNNNGFITEQDVFDKEQPLVSDDSILGKNGSEENTLKSSDTIAGLDSNTLKEIIKIGVNADEKNEKADFIVENSELTNRKPHSNNSHKANSEKKSSHKESAKSHHSKKPEKLELCEGDKYSDKHKIQKQLDSTSKHKHERRPSSVTKDRHRIRDRVKDDEQHRKSKCKGNETEKVKKPSLPLEPSKKGVNSSKEDTSRTKTVDKVSDKNRSKSNDKYNRKDEDKHLEKLKDRKKNHHGSKSNFDELTKKPSSSKSSKHSSDHHRDKLKMKTSIHTKVTTVSSSHRNDGVSKTKKRKLEEEELLHSDKRMKVSNKSTSESDYKPITANHFAEIDIFSHPKKQKDISKLSSIFNNDSSHTTCLDNSGPDEMDDDSIIYSPENRDLDAISISSSDSSSIQEETQDARRLAICKQLKMEPQEEPMDCTAPDTLSSVSDKKWTKAKAIIQRNNNTKMRIAHVPNVSNILSAKTRLLSNTPQTPTSNTVTTSAVTGHEEDVPLPRVTKRIAHGGQGSENRFPTLIHSHEVKVNASIRQHFCNIFYNELGKFMSPEDARKRAAAEEFEVAKKCSLSKIYRNNCSLLLLKIRKNKGNLPKDEAAAEKLDASYIPDYTYGWSLYKCFLKYVLSDEELIQHGYPMPLPGQSNCAYTEKSARRYCVQQPDKPFSRKCVNCGKLYEIDEDGMPTTSNDCLYHWGRLRRMGRGLMTEKFTCCDGADDATPCQTSTYHVWSGRNEDCMPGFVKTKEFPSGKDESCAGVYALDCEMCYTTRGLELARLTVVDLNEVVVFDEVVSLECPVLDYCTRFSGIDEKKMSLATYTFDDVQQWVLDNVYDKTILVGHSLENDLKVLKVFHKRIVDTSVTFPHKFGFPQKCSLKFLASSVLSTTIQESEHGHDSKEDAVTCLRLIMTKIREDSKVRKPRSAHAYCYFMWCMYPNRNPSGRAVRVFFRNHSSTSCNIEYYPAKKSSSEKTSSARPLKKYYERMGRL